jgi:hypothetical protein
MEAKITFTRTGKKQHIELWANRHGTLSEIMHSARRLLEDLIQEGHRKVVVYVDGKRIRAENEGREKAKFAPKTPPPGTKEDNQLPLFA